MIQSSFFSNKLEDLYRKNKSLQKNLKTSKTVLELSFDCAVRDSIRKLNMVTKQLRYKKKMNFNCNYKINSVFIVSECRNSGCLLYDQLVRV